MSELNLFLKEYNRLIEEYTYNIRKAHILTNKHYKDFFVFENIPLKEYSLNIAKTLNEYDEKVIVSSILYNPYKYSLDLKKKGFIKDIRKICKDVYFLNFYQLSLNQEIPIQKIKEMIINSFFKIESIIIIFGEALTILDYFLKIKDNSFKERFFQIVQDVLIPIAYQLGMHNFKEKLLEKLMSLKYKTEFKKICKYLEEKYPVKNTDILKEIIIDFLKNKNFKPLKYNYRYKSPGSFYQKIHVRKKSIENILDVYAIRLIYNTKKECYKALDLFLNNFNIIENENKLVRDYIKHPKKNGYQSIHLNIYIDNYPVEIQIRTADMHNNAEFGVSAHFHYKNIESSQKDFRLIKYLKEKNIVEKIKDASYKDYVVIYSQTNEEFFIPKKATLLDFAFYLHTDFAKYFDHAQINGEIIKDKSYVLKNGDKIKIIRSKKISLNKEDINFIFVKNNRKKFNFILKELSE
jgi:GTP diphosphokinase / guanosine-3',5'-bis(diphosphate) 3'-diphosphatase